MYEVELLMRNKCTHVFNGLTRVNVNNDIVSDYVLFRFEEQIICYKSVFEIGLIGLKIIQINCLTADVGHVFHVANTMIN